MTQEIIQSLRILLEDCCDGAIKVQVVAEALKKVANNARIAKRDELPEDLTGDGKLWVTSDHQLIIDGIVVAEWTRCAVGCWGQLGQPGDAGWYVEEDQDGGDTLPLGVSLALEIFGLEDSVPDVPEPEKADKFNQICGRNRIAAEGA